ncbi:MAG: hypothetical protein SGPRY_002912 [Prymnesium sp.]
MVTRHEIPISRASPHLDPSHHVTCHATAHMAPEGPPLCSRAGGPSSPLAVLGVLTFEERREYRERIRASWMSHPPSPPSLPALSSTILTRFVVRGIGASDSMVREGEERGDVIFLRAPSALRRTIGPLTSFVRWLECAVSAWPNAQLIGKADDDVWLHLQSTASLLHATFTSLSDSSPNGVAPRVLWGHMESYSWDVSAGRPAWHGYSWFKSHDCRQRTMRREEVLARSLAHANKTECRVAKDERGVARCGGGDEAVVAGPFGFPKGPLFFASTSLVAQLLADPELTRETERVLQSVNNSRKEGIKPWEDVYIGMALARTSRFQDVALVHIGCAVYTDVWGFFMTPSTVVWHMGSKPSEMDVLHRN